MYATITWMHDEPFQETECFQVLSVAHSNVSGLVLASYICISGSGHTYQVHNKII